MRMRCVIFLMVLLIYSMPRGSGSRRGADGLFLGARDSMVTPLSDVKKEVMEEIWSNCRLDFSVIKYVMRGVDLLLPDDSAGYSPKLNLEKFPFRGEDLQETINHLPAEMKHSLIVCLINQNLLVRISGGPSPTGGYSRHMTRLLDQGPLFRRLLAGQPVNENLLVYAAALAPHRRIQASKTTSALPPAPASAPLNGVNNNPQPSSSAPIPEDNPHEFSPTLLPDGYLDPEVKNSAPRRAVAPSEQKSNKSQTIVIVVVITATVTFTLAALCFCCLYRHLRRKYQSDNEQRDGRPLLSLSLGNFSGSSHLSFGLANPSHQDKNSAFSFKTDPIQNGQVGSFDSLSELQVDEVHSSVSSSTEPTNAPSNAPAPAPPPPLKPPLGRSVASPSPSPPLPNTKPALPLPKAELPPPKEAPPLPSPNAPPPPKGGPPPPKGGPPPPKVGPPPPPKIPSHPVQANLISSTIPRPPSNLSTNAFDSDGAKTKLKPFFWDKVMANPNQSMVWHEIKSGSFQFNEEMIETLFGYNAADKRWNDARKDLGNDPSSHRIQILDPKKAQNLAISLKAQNVKVEEVCDALMEGNELPIELLQELLRMAPTTDEELKLRLLNDNTALLGPAEQFLKAIINIPFAFKRMETLLLMTTLQEESTFVKESYATLEEACKELRNSRLFLKLLEAVLKTGNRMNNGTYRGGAQAFKLDTLLKLSDVKGADGKTTLLHFVVQEIIRSEGRRAVRVAEENRSNSSITISSFNSEVVPEESEDQYCTLGLRTVSGLSSELKNVKKAAGLDADALTSAVASIGHRLVTTKEFLSTDMRKLEEESSFHDLLKAFVEHAEVDIARLLEEEKRIRSLVKNITDYFHGNAGRDEGLRLFVVVRDFLRMLDKACKEVREAPNKGMKTQRNTLQPIPEPRPILFPSIKDQHVDDFSSDDEES